MAKIPHDLQVVIPYDTLVELLRASEELPKMQDHIIQQDKKIDGLRGQFVELMEVFGEMRKLK